MFTGIITDVGTVRSAEQRGDLRLLIGTGYDLGTVDLGGLLPSVNYTPQLGPASRMTSLTVVDPTVAGFLKPLVTFFESDAAKNMAFGS